MDTSYLAQQVTTIIGQLHGLFDDIGVPSHERDSREAELFSALSETLHNQLRQVTNEKHEMTEEAHRLLKTIRQMEASLDDNKPNPNYEDPDDDDITFPLTRCLQGLKERYNTISKRHQERFEQVRKLAEALESYASHLEASFVQIKLPPTEPNATVSPSFDISPSYVNKLDNEFTRVYEEYTRRINTVKVLCQEIIQLWAELGTPQAQTDSAIVQCHRDAPEQLGLHKDDLAQLKAKKERLVEEKRSRERRLGQLRTTIEELWDRLGVEERERKQFLTSNRGCGLRTINEYEDELARLNELKRQNLHLFVEEARCKLQELWDALYFSEEEMLDFTPAFSDVCSDALLSAHESEIARLEALKEQRLPILQKIDRHRELIKERDDLQQSSQDATRLMARGNKGERRDPGKLLREEKMRKRIAKELPKVEAELKDTLENWEDEYGRPFLVHGNRYLDELYAAAAAAKAAPPRAKTPSNTGMPSKPATVSRSTAPSRAGTVRGLPPTRSKTPVSNFGASVSRHTLSSSVSSGISSNFGASVSASGPKSPSKIPSRATLKSAPLGDNPSERRPALSREDSTTLRKMAPPMAPPPRMKDLFVPPEPSTMETPMNRFAFNRGERSESIVRNVPPEDPYDDGPSYMGHHNTMRGAYTPTYPPPSLSSASSRQISQTSSNGTAATGVTMQSGSENWETFSERSDEPPEEEIDFHHYRRQMKRYTPEGGHIASPRGVQGKKIRSIRSVDGEALTEQDGRMVRVKEGSDAGWTDDGDGY
ncbi:protein regulator of cytokinesis 1 [Pyrenophora tritici-repentis Pt-1C-BFP]|uniref:Protein regulator of cytokinesis 1 n=1 Tax=Pyrenophora tritici-repentis (strain Pt-1C-BFP) TaxID=426418 RepID=B2W816_PYRTR|nr:protein regulator of cytokinesis 1 [Pyrenophora tritici-repentis Pt-1C-BFP]EDU48874.1 protein regulator of cytokinesis 1 [Pyrenophora tritici-repentis Pt-1C-BFP]PWO23229.1 ChaA, Ca2+H+ antiporter [Pyrenophora tritici-repentis]